MFTRDAIVLLRQREGNSTRSQSHFAAALIWKTLPGFYKWYARETGTTDVLVLRFELLDVCWPVEKAFFFPKGDLKCFQTLKQHIWDFFWVASDLNGAPATFRIRITPAPRLANEAPTRSSHAPRRNAGSATASILPGAPSASSSEAVRVIAGSQPLVSIVPHIPYGPPTPRPPPLSPDNHKITTPQKHLSPVQMNYISSIA